MTTVANGSVLTKAATHSSSSMRQPQTQTARFSTETVYLIWSNRFRRLTTQAQTYHNWRIASAYFALFTFHQSGNGDCRCRIVACVCALLNHWCNACVLIPHASDHNCQPQVGDDHDSGDRKKETRRLVTNCICTLFVCTIGAGIQSRLAQQR